MIYAIFTNSNPPSFIAYGESEYLVKEFAKAKMMLEKEMSPLMQRFTKLNIETFSNEESLLRKLTEINIAFSFFNSLIVKNNHMLSGSKVVTIHSKDNKLTGVCVKANIIDENSLRFDRYDPETGGQIICDAPNVKREYLIHSIRINAILENYVRNMKEISYDKRIIPILKDMDIDMIKLVLTMPILYKRLNIFPI